MKTTNPKNGFVKFTLLMLGIIVFIAGGTIGYIGNASENPIIILAGFGFMACGFLLMKRWFGRDNVRIIASSGNGHGEGVLMEPNCLNLHRGKMAFEYVSPQEVKGQEQKNHNDGKYYYVHIDNILGDLEEFTLPDDDEKERFYDPNEVANVITMPSNKKYFTWSASWMETAKLGIMGLVIGGEIIGLIATV